jgi:hypothetical protein
MNERGKDSWGMTDGTFVYKAVGQIVDQFDELDMESPTYHCRGASIGCISHRNAHPFEFTHEANGHKKRVVGVHNGHVNNWGILKTRYNRQHFEVDSEHIFAHLAEDKPISDIEGWGTVVWYEQIDDGPIQRYFSTFSNGQLAIAHLKTGEFIFASTERSVQIAIQMTGALLDTFYKIEPDIKYSIINGELKSLGEFKWGKEWLAPKIILPITYTRHNHNHYNRDNRDVCAMKECKTIVKEGDLICTWCLIKIKKEYGFDENMSVYGGY